MPALSVNVDHAADLAADAALPGVAAGAEEAAAHCREAWRVVEELNVNPQLALEALFVRLRRAFPAEAYATAP